MARKAFTYSSFIIASLALVMAFITAKSYIQLGVAVILYPLFMLFVYKLFIKGDFFQPQLTAKKLTPPEVDIRLSNTKPERKSESAKLEKVEIENIDKRTFIKLIGTVGVTYFLFSLLGRRVESLFFGKTLDYGLGGVIAPDNQSSGGATSTEGYKISEIDDASLNSTYYGFINKDGAWFIMREDVETNTYRYTRGTSDFSKNWSKRNDLKYDYYYNLF